MNSHSFRYGFLTILSQGGFKKTAIKYQATSFTVSLETGTTTDDHNTHIF